MHLVKTLIRDINRLHNWVRRWVWRNWWLRKVCTSKSGIEKTQNHKKYSLSLRLHSICNAIIWLIAKPPPSESSRFVIPNSENITKPYILNRRERNTIYIDMKCSDIFKNLLHFISLDFIHCSKLHDTNKDCPSRIAYLGNTHNDITASFFWRRAWISSRLSDRKLKMLRGGRKLEGKKLLLQKITGLHRTKISLLVKFWSYEYVMKNEILL